MREWTGAELGEAPFEGAGVTAVTVEVFPEGRPLSMLIRCFQCRKM